MQDDKQPSRILTSPDDATLCRREPDRRRFLKAAAVGSAAAVAAPWIGNVQAQEGIRIRMQSSWQPGTIGYRTFEAWAKGVVRLRVKPRPFSARKESVRCVAPLFDRPNVAR